jgi:hypothetical protein
MGVQNLMSDRFEEGPRTSLAPGYQVGSLGEQLD